MEEYTDKNQETTTYKYDPNGNVVRVIDAQGNPSFYEYDSLNQLIKVTMFRATEEQITGYQYSSDGLSLTNANGAEAQVTRYEYDERGLLTKTVNPKDYEKTYRYDLKGNLAYTKDEDGNGTDYDYNAKNLLKTVEYNDGKKAECLYDAGGRLKEVKDWTGTTSFDLDLLGRINKVNQKDNQQNNRGTLYSYNDAFHQMTLTYPDNSAVKYTWDEINRLTSVRDGSNNLIAGYQYDKANRLKRLDYGNGFAERYEYDALGQLLETYELFNGQESLLYKYAYYDDGNIKESYMSDAVEGKLPEAAVNEYSILDQLTSKTLEDGSIIDYTYDKRGNIVRETDRATGKALRSFDYDATNRMVKATNAQGETSEYTYNALGYLVSHNGTPQVSDYTSYTQRVLQDGNKSFVYGLDMIFVSMPTAKEYVQTDRLGSAVKGRDANGNLASLIHYNEWGSPTVVTQGLVTSNYTGHSWDLAIGAYFAKARFYDLDTMRFIAADPIKGNIMNPQTMNPYIYCYNNPLMHVDPDGMKPYSKSTYDGKYALFVTSQEVDATVSAIGMAPVYGWAFTGLNWASQRFIVGHREINYDITGGLSFLSGVTGRIPEEAVQTASKWAGRALSAIDVSTYLYDWFYEHNYRIEEAIYNQFTNRVWTSNSRNQVDNKFKYVMEWMTYHIAFGCIEVKKAGDAFGEDEFYKHPILGMATYQYDPLKDTHNFFKQDDYYFFATNNSIHGKIKFMEDVMLGNYGGFGLLISPPGR